MPLHAEFLAEAIRLARESARGGTGGPFGAVVVRDGGIIATGHNQVTSANDPTAHAEIVAIRAACRALGTFALNGCVLYTSCEPCPMCLGAIYWARLDAVFFAATREDAARAGFDDAFFYAEMTLPMNERHLPMRQMMRDEALAAFDVWTAKPDKMSY